MHLSPISSLWLALFATVIDSYSALGSSRRDSKGYKSVSYFANWVTYERNFNPQDLNGNELTHVLYAFANIRPETGEVYLSDTWSDTDKHYATDSWNSAGINVYGCAKQLFLQKKRNRKLKTLLSIGGWTYSSNFARPASSPAGRAMFASSAVRLLKDLGFDGLDVDWEYPQNEAEAENFVSLLAETRNQLDAYSEQSASGYHMLLTVASPAGPMNYKTLKLAAMDRYLDFWNMMAYDYSGPQDSVAGHSSNLKRSTSDAKSTPFDTEQAVADYIAAGIPASKIVVGMPLYGRAFANTDGPGKPFTGVGNGTWELGVYDYKDLPLSGAVVNIDNATVAAWSYDPAKRHMVSFDTTYITRLKATFVKHHKLGGAMWWESSGDKKGANDSLISTFVNAVGGVSALEQSQNLLSYPASKYENMRAGMLDS